MGWDKERGVNGTLTRGWRMKQVGKSDSVRVRGLALCPWHNENTASLLIDFMKGTFRCVGCGANGIVVEGPDEPIPDGFVRLQEEDGWNEIG